MRPRFSREFMTLGGAILFTLSGGYSSRAQGQRAVPSDEDFRWEATAVLGRAGGGPGDDVEEVLRSTGWVRPRTSHELSWLVSLRHTLRPKLEAELLSTRTRIATSHAGANLSFFRLESNVAMIAPIVSLRLGAWHIGAGPTLHRVGVGGEETKEAWKVGGLADTGFTFPRRTRVFFEGRAQYRWIPGHTEAGPFTEEPLFPEDNPGITPAMELDMSHTFLSLGLGMRF